MWGRCSRGDLDEPVQRKLAAVHTVVVDQLQTVFDARTAVGDLGEIVFTQHLLIGEKQKGQWSVENHLKVVVLEAVPRAPG